MKLYLKELLAYILGVDFRYPVGSYYETSDANFDPNITWGGTWSLLSEGQVLLSAGTNYIAGREYGKNSVTLTAAIGACNSDIASLGYITDGPSAYQFSHGPGYVLGTSNKGFSGWNHGTPVTDTGVNSRDTSIMQKSTACYIWHRTA